MNRNDRKAIAELLPKHAYDKTPSGDHIDATWTTPAGHYTLKTSKWDRDNWGIVATRVELTNAEGETITLKTTDVDRVREAMVLLGCGPTEGQ